MDHFLTRLIDRTLGKAPGVSPLIPSIYADAPDRGDEPRDSQAQRREPSHEGFAISQRPRFVGRFSREGDLPSPGHGKKDRNDGAGDPFLEKPNPPRDSKEIRGDPPPFDNNAMPSEEHSVVARESDGQWIPAKTASLPSSETQRNASACFQPPMEGDFSKRPSSVTGDTPHRSERLPVNASPTAIGGTDAVSRPDAERQPRERQQRQRDAHGPSACGDLLVPIPSTGHTTVATPETRATVFESSPHRVSGPRSSPPPTKVTIGRIEVRAVIRQERRPPAAEPDPEKRGPALSLEDYLGQRDRNRL